MFNSNLLLLGDIEAFFGIVFFLIAFVGWVINLVSQNQQQPKGRRSTTSASSRTPNRKREVQNEIDSFLNQSRRQPRRSDEEDLDEIEVIEAPPSRRPPPRRRRTREEILQEQREKSAKPVVPPHPPGEKLQKRHHQSSQSQRKKTQPVPSKFENQIKQDLPHSVDQSVTEHLRTFTAGEPSSTGQMGMSQTTRRSTGKAGIVRKLLTSQKGVRDAIILNEVLSPPKALRK